MTQADPTPAEHPQTPEAVPVIDMQGNSHTLDWMNNRCPFDWQEAHIHVSPDYGDGTFEVVGFGPGMPTPHQAKYHEAPALPSWWDRIRGRTLDAVIRRVTDEIARAGNRRASSTAVIEAVRDALEANR